MILLVGRSPALLEGIAQSLAGTAAVAVAHSLPEAEITFVTGRTAFVVAERSLLEEASGQDFGARLVATATALVTYSEAPGATRHSTFAPGLARLVVADLELPLERHRLKALAERILERARTSGRVADDPPRASPM
jgi:hypothetical protein